jgi:putative DNA primase/helicase
MNIYDYQSKIGNLSIVDRYRRGGVNVIPIKADGSKQPCLRFAEYYKRRFPANQLGRWFASRGRPNAIGIICGSTSGGLEVIDFDGECERIYPAYCALVPSGLRSRLVVIETPKGGRHLYYRCETIEGNQKLAADERGGTLIETRGQGGYVLAPGSPPQSHTTGRLYQVLENDPATPPTITTDERQLLLSVARRFNRFVAVAETTPRPHTTAHVGELLGDGGHSAGNRPGDDYNRRTGWDELLTGHGWTYSHSSGGVDYWQRPDKIGRGCSASVGYAESDKLFVFSTNATPFQAGVSYSKFAAFALLEHHGDYQAAAHDLAEKGYGGVCFEISDFIIGGIDD